MKPLLAPAFVLCALAPAPLLAQLSRLVVLPDIEGEEGVVEIGSHETSLGTNVTRAGDVDGDGLDDVLLAAPGHSEVVLLYGQSGLPAKLDAYSGQARLSLMTAGPFDPWSIEVGGGSDVNGDGIDDFFVGEAETTTIVFGSRSLPAAFNLKDIGSDMPGIKVAFDRHLTFQEWPRTNVHLGGDITGDGMGEILVGDPHWEREAPGRGKVHIIFGGASLPSSIDLDDVGSSVPGLVIEGMIPDFPGRDGDRIGLCVQMAGDLDGDGLGDIGIGGNACGGGNYIIYGRQEFPPLLNVDQIPGAFGVFLEGVSGCMKSMGDLDGDGRGEVTLQHAAATYDVILIAGRSRALLGPFQDAQRIISDPRNIVIHERSGLCPAALPIDGRDVDGDGRTEILFARDSGTVFLPQGINNDGLNGLVYVFPIALDLPRETSLHEARHHWGFYIAGKSGDILGYGTDTGHSDGGLVRQQPVPLNMGLLSDFNGDGLGDILLGAGIAGRPGGSRAYIVPYRALSDPRLEITAVSPGKGLVEGGEQVRITGRGIAPGTRFFFGDFEAEVISAPNQREVVVRAPPWGGGSHDVSVRAIRDSRMSDLPGAFRYVDVPVIDVEEIAAGTIAGGELYTKRRDISGGPVMIESLQVIRDINGDGVDEIVIETEVPGPTVVYGGPHLSGRIDYFEPPHALALPTPGSLHGTVFDYIVRPVEGSGDVDGDGVGDMIVWSHTNGGEHWLHVIHGGDDLPLETHPADFPRRSRISMPYRHQSRIVEDLEGGGRADLVFTAFEDVASCQFGGGASFGVWIVHGEDLVDIHDVDWLELPKLLIRTSFERIDTYESLDANGDGLADLAFQARGCGMEGIIVLFGGEHLSGAGEILVDDSFLQGGKGGIAAMGRRFRSDGWPSLGFVLAPAGDIDGDGRGELLAGSPFIHDSEGRLREAGEAYVVSFRQDLEPPPDSEEAREWAGAFGITPFTILDSALGRRGVLALPGDSADRRLGHGVAGGGDLNGDGVADLAVGQGTFELSECGRCSGVTNAGVPYTFVFFGEERLLDGSVSEVGIDNADVDLVLRGGGYHVAGLSDVSGDGHADLIVSRYGEKAYILFGGPALGRIRFRRGDVDLNGLLDISDAISTLAYLFLGNAPPRCEDAADTNDDGAIDIADPISLLGHLFLGGHEPSPPFPDPGADPTEDALSCSGF